MGKAERRDALPEFRKWLRRKRGSLGYPWTPIAAVAVMVSGAMAWFGRLSWWWLVAVVIGTVLVFGGPQIVSWIRGLFGV